MPALARKIINVFIPSKIYVFFFLTAIDLKQNNCLFEEITNKEKLERSLFFDVWKKIPIETFLKIYISIFTQMKIFYQNV